MKLIKVKHLLSTMNPEHYIEIFSSNKRTKDVECASYKVKEIPSKLKNLFVGYSGTLTKERFSVSVDHSFPSVVVIDAYDKRKDAIDIIKNRKK